MSPAGGNDLLIEARAALLDALEALDAQRDAGLEAAIVDNSHIDIDALDPGDSRVYTARVAGPAALLVAKLHKIGERTGAPDRLVDKDAHDIYRILVAVPTAQLASTLRTLGADPISREATNHALEYFDRLFATGPHAIGSTMAGRAEEGIGDPEQVALAVSLLASDALDAVRDDTSVERRRRRAESRRP